MRIAALRRKPVKGLPAESVSELSLAAGRGIAGDAYAGNLTRQVSLLPVLPESSLRAEGLCASKFLANIEIVGLAAPIPGPGTTLRVGNAVLEVESVGKECYGECAVFRGEGPCVLARKCVFARVVEGGTVRIGDTIALGRSAL